MENFVENYNLPRKTKEIGGAEQALSRAAQKARGSWLARGSSLARSLTARSVVDRAVNEPARLRLGPI